MYLGEAKDLSSLTTSKHRSFVAPLSDVGRIATRGIFRQRRAARGADERPDRRRDVRDAGDLRRRKAFDAKKTPFTSSGSSEQWSPLHTSRLSSKTVSVGTPSEACQETR